MECSHCKKDFAKGVRTAYKIGLLHGEDRLKQTINCIKITNRRLFDELLRLDRVQPLDSCCVKLSSKYAESLIKTLRNNKLIWHANKLQKQVTSQLSQPEILEEIQEK